LLFIAIYALLTKLFGRELSLPFFPVGPLSWHFLPRGQLFLFLLFFHVVILILAVFIVDVERL
jgi:hypothetical protein